MVSLLTVTTVTTFAYCRLLHACFRPHGWRRESHTDQDRFGAGKVRCVKATRSNTSFLGVILVTRSDSSLSSAAEGTYPDIPSHPVLGDLAALLSAAFYAVYVVFLKVRVGDEERADMQLMLG